MEELKCDIVFPDSRVSDPQKSEMETDDPPVLAQQKPLQDGDARMEESEGSPGNCMVCDPSSRLVHNGISKSSYTEDIVAFINAGSEIEKEGDCNMRFLADAHFKGGSVLRIKETIPEGGDYPFIYQSARLGDFSYQLNNLPPGDYFVDLHFAEIINVNGPKGMRVFNVLIQDEKVLSEFDIYALVGANKPLQLVDSRASVKDDGLIDIRFEGVVGSPLACGVCIRKAPKLPDSHMMHEHIRCSSCTADIEVPMTLMRNMRQRNTAVFEKKIEDLNVKFRRKKEECSQAWMSLAAANDQLKKIRTELDNKLFQTYTLDQRVEKQTAEIKALSNRYEEGKKTWISAINNLEDKIKAMKQEHIELSREAHECADSIPELNQMIVAVQALVAECEDLKTKYLDEQRMRKKLYNEVQEAKGNIRVFCRCRPLTKTEQVAGHSAIVDFEGAKDGDIVIQSGGSNRKSFKFDRVYSPANDQVDVFADASPVVTSVLDGYNVCIFAYGQTGTGKTFTMEGTEKNRGVNYRTLEKLFSIAEERKDVFTYEISVSVLEIYNEQIRDLLATSSSKKLEIKQDSSGSHHVPGLVEAKVDNTQEVWRVLQAGSNARAVGSNNVNERSSRSHCMLSIMVKAKNLMSSESTKSKLWLVDLAGSERLAKTDAQGERLKEAQNINKSLSALGDVISALANKSSHIPYRNSKLTHLLQDSLGGDSKTLMFVQISPSERDMGETLSSLNFASRVRGVELGPVKRQVDTGELQKTKMQLDRARMESKSKDESIKKLEESLQNLENKARGRDQTYKVQQEKIRELEDELGSKISFNTQLEKQISQLQERLKEKEEACSSLQHKVNELENKLRQQEHMDTATLDQVKELERKLKEQIQESDSSSLILQNKIKELEEKLKEQGHNHVASLLHQKVKELEKKVREQEQLEQNNNQPTNHAHDMAPIGATPVGSRPALKDEALAEIDPLVLRISNSVSSNRSQGSNGCPLIKGNGEIVRRKREFRSSDIENNVPFSGPSQHDKKIRKSDPPKPHSRPTRNVAKPVAGQRPSFGRSIRDQSNKDKETKKKMWC